jgi:hypothetical protein
VSEIDWPVLDLDDVHVRAAVRKLWVHAIRRFAVRVNERAEAEMLKTGTLEGAHHRAIEAELAMLPGGNE